MDHARVAAHEAETPPCHVVGLRRREDLDADLLGARHLEERGRPITVEREVRVREVVNDHQPVLAREVDDALEEGAVHAHRRRVVREGEDQHLRLRPRQLCRFVEPREEVAVEREGHGAQVAVGDHDGVGVDGIRRVRDEHAVAGLEHGERQVRHAFLGADRGDHFAVGIQLHLVAVAIPRRHRVAEEVAAPGCGVSVILRILGGLYELGDDVLRRRHVGVAHAQIDDVLAAGAGFRLQVVDDGEDVRREAFDPIEIVHIRSPSSRDDTRIRH